MTAGDLIHLDQQVELAGLLLGETTQFQLEELDLFAAPNASDQDTDRNDQGVMPGADRYQGRLLTVNLWLDAFPDMDAMLEDRANLEAAFSPSSTERELHFRVGGQHYCYYGRGRGITVDMPTNQPWTAECRFLATDPRVFSGAQHTLVLPPGTPIVATNAGTRSTPWRLVVEGQMDHPELVRTSDPATYTWSFPSLDVDTGHTLTVDTRTGLALYDGASVIGQARDAGGSALPFPWEFPAGDVEWEFTAGDSDGTATLVWRDAWA